MQEARSLGVPMSVWDGWSEEDRGWFLALRQVEAEEEAATCPVCGGPRAECGDRANQYAFEVDGGWCYRRKALIEASEAKFKDKQGRVAAAASVMSARLNPAKRRG